jgi:biopolymer transport protein ExbB
MLELIIAGGWLMLPIIACSILALAISLEKMYVLRQEKVAPHKLLPLVLGWVNAAPITRNQVRDLRAHSFLGRIFAAGLISPRNEKITMQRNIEEAGRYVLHDMERNLNFLGTIVMITPLLGLLGTVFGMIQVFSTIMHQGVGNATALAGGISVALITTAAGLSIAIPAMVMHRYFTRKVDSLLLHMEAQSQLLADALYKHRPVPLQAAPGVQKHAISSSRA